MKQYGCLCFVLSRLLPRSRLLPQSLLNVLKRCGCRAASQWLLLPFVWCPACHVYCLHAQRFYERCYKSLPCCAQTAMIRTESMPTRCPLDVSSLPPV